MGLKGQLEDLPLIDMLQIIAFSKKSGYLRVAGPAGRGAVILSDGRVLFAFSWSTMERIRELAHDPDKISIKSNRENIEAALRELAGLREGSFKFELTSEISDDLGGVRIKPFMIPGGIDPQELLLDLAVEIDNERREATSLLELAFQGDPPAEEAAAVEVEADQQLEQELPSQPKAVVIDPPAPAAAEVVAAPVAAPAVASVAEHVESLVDEAAADARSQSLTVVVVDDETLIVEVVGDELRERGYQVSTASSPGDGADMVRACVQRGDTVLVALDLKMPTSSGESFLGGFELIRRLHSDRLQVPVLLMVESFDDDERAQAKALGVRRIVYKPTLTKPDPVLYRTDLREFTDSVDKQLKKLVDDDTDGVDSAAHASGEENEAERVDFLARMTKKLVEPGGSTDVSLLVMHVAARFLERGVLFVVKSESARGLAGFGFGTSKKNCAEVTRALSIAIDQSSALTELVSTSKTQRLGERLQSLDSCLFSVIGRGNAAEGVLVPMLYNRATLLLLYGDNGVSGRALDDLGELELFIAQAGMALENKLLQRKLSSGDAVGADNMEQGVQP